MSSSFAQVSRVHFSLVRPVLRLGAVMSIVMSVVAAASSAFAHGGSYRPPAGEIPPESRDPHDPPPPPEGNGPGTPRGEDPTGPVTPGGGVGGGPVTPGDGGAAPGTGTGGPPPAAGDGPGGPTTTGPRRGRGNAAGFDDWQWWWAYDQHEILALRGLMRGMRAPISGFGPHRADGGSGSRTRSATDSAILTDVVPLLRDIFGRESEDFDVRSAAGIALAKIGDTSITVDLCRLADRTDPKTHPVVAESAALSLGLLEKDDAPTREFLLRTVADRSRSGSLVRPFAAVALGFQPAKGADADAVRTALLDVVAGREAGEDAKPSCLLALGTRGDAAAVPALLQMVKTARGSAGGTELSDVEVAYAIDALGRIVSAALAVPAGGATSGPLGDTAVLDELLRIVGDDSASNHVVRSAVIACGRVLPTVSGKPQDRGIDALVRAAAATNGDSQTRHFALIALGRVGADPRTSDVVRGRCADALGRVLDRGQPANVVQPFAALGLGILGRAQMLAGRSVDEESIRKPLREKFAAARDPSSRGAFALASGLIRDRLACDGLLAVASDGGANVKVRAYACLALGIIGDPRALEPLRAAAAEDRDRDLSLQAAMGLGLLGDARAVDDLVRVISDPDRSQYVLGSAAIALGTMGDERAIAPLCAIVRDGKRYPDLTRALAVVALGRIGDRRDVPSLARLSTGFNYRANVPATRELLTIL